MNIKEIYEIALAIGVENDFRTKKEVENYLVRQNKLYEKLSKEDKKFFDKERLSNPFSDSRIHFDNGIKKVKKVMAGIDISVGGILLAKELGIDLIINHHPVGLALAGLDAVMDLQVDVMEKIGVPVAIAEKMIHKRISEVARRINPVNHYVEVDAARLLGVNMINIHTPADNCAAQFLTKLIEKKPPRYVEDVLKIIEAIPEYQAANKLGAGPVLFSGNKNNRAGKTVVTEFTGGTEGSKEIYKVMAGVGIGTLISMHQSEDHRNSAEEAHINVVVAGHISSDSLGMNIILDEIEKKGVQVVPYGGLIRIKRI